MNDPDYQKIRFHILNKLYLRNKWGASHTSIDLVSKGLPRHQIGDAKDIAKDLITEGLLLSKPSTKELHVSLNPRKKAEICGIINEGPGE
jgi:hypothetical protein